MKKLSAAAIFTLLICFILEGCINIDSQIPEVATDIEGNVVTKADANGYQVDYYNVNNGVTELVPPPADNAAESTIPAAQQPVAQESATQAPATTLPAAVENTTAVPAGVSLTTDEEKLNFFNTAVNKVKSQNAGFTKAKKTIGTDMELSNALVNAVAGALKDSLLPNDTVTTTVAGGESSVDIMSPPGQTYASALTLADCQSIVCEQNGENYVITISLADQTYPDATDSSYAKIFEFITVDDIMNTYAPDMNATVERENVFFDFSGCYAKATITPDGVLVNYETFVNGTMRLTNGKIRGFTTDLNIVLSSTTTYTDFQW